MRLQTKPNPWSCIGTAFAMVLDMSTADFFGLVGHDGSQIAFPMLSDPMARRGLHIQECIAACVKLGYAVTPIELFPVIRPTSANGHAPNKEDLVVLFGDDESANWERFEQTIETSTGVLEGLGRRCLHAVAYDHGMLFDPDGDQYVHSHSACESRCFHPRRAWRVDYLTSELPQEDHTMSSYDHDLTNKITKALDREQNEQLFHRIVSGNRQAREEMIEGNMPLVIVRVNSFIQRHPQLAHLRDDLHSAGFVGLVQAVNKMADGAAIINPTDYISAAITNELTALRTKEADNGFAKIATADRKEAKLPTVIHSVPESVEDSKQAATQGAFEVRDMLESCCESDEESTLIRMREEGCSDREIAEALNMSRTSAHTLRRRLEERFNQKYHESEEG